MADEFYYGGINTDQTASPEPESAEADPMVSAGLYEMVKDVNTAVVPAMYEGKTRKLTYADFRQYKQLEAEGVAPKAVVLSLETLRSIHRQMGDSLFFQMLRRIEVWTTVEGSDYIEAFWDSYNSKSKSPT